MPLSGRNNIDRQCLTDATTIPYRCPAHWVRAKALSLWGFLKEVRQNTIQDRLPITAAAISFFMFFSVIPLLGLAFSITAFVLAQREDLIVRMGEIITQYLGAKVTSVFTGEVFAFVHFRGVLTGVALVTGLWTGGQVFTIMEHAMNQIWRAERHRSFIHSRLLGFAMLFISVFILFTAVVLLYLAKFLEAAHIPIWGHQVRDIHFLPALISMVVPFLLTTLMFGTIYRILPSRQVTWQSALPGAIFSAVVWMIFVRVFGPYALMLTKYSLIYGTLGNLVLLMILFYYSSLIMLMGAEIASVYHRRLLAAGDVEEQRVEAEAEQG